MFNAVLAERVRRDNWDRLLGGEIVNLDGSGSVFGADAPDAELLRRCAAFDVHPTGPLWGRGELRPRGEALELETAVTGTLEPVTAALEAAGLQHERRALRLKVEAFEAHLGEDLEVSFRLGPGAFATVVLRELVAANVAGVNT